MGNLVRIDGRLVEKKVSRFTPAGVPVAEARLLHESDVIEANLPRQVRCEVPLLALGEAAKRLNAAPLDVCVEVEGFLAVKSRNSKTLVLHVQTLEFLEGTQNAPILQEEG